METALVPGCPGTARDVPDVPGKGVGGRSFSVASRPPIAASRPTDPKLPGSRLLQVQAYGSTTEAVAEQLSGDHFCIPVLWAVMFL